MGGKRYEKEREMRLKPAIYENTRVPPQKEANPASLRSSAPSKGRGSRGHSLLPMEGGAPKGRRLDGDSGMKDKWGNASQVDDIREHPIHRWRGPPSPMGKAAIREQRYPRHKAFPLRGRLRGPARSAPLLFAAKPLPQP